MRFEKWQALGNDYVIVEQRDLPFELTPSRIRALCAHHFGIGADGVLLLAAPSDPQDVADLRIFNPDGSEAELSGNGVREAVLYLRRRGWTSEDSFSIGTLAGRIRPTITGPDTCQVDMGTASTVSRDFPGGPPDGRGEIETAGRRFAFQHISIGNPQCSIRLDSEAELAALDLVAVGAPIEADPRFPHRTNVSFYVEQSPPGPGEEPARVHARIYERGVGETLASGTGASGAAIAYALALRSPPWPVRVTVELDGGELGVEVRENLRVFLTGWARPVYEGHTSDEFTEDVRKTE